MFTLWPYILKYFFSKIYYLIDLYSILYYLNQRLVQFIVFNSLSSVYYKIDRCWMQFVEKSLTLLDRWIYVVMEHQHQLILSFFLNYTQFPQRLLRPKGLICVAAARMLNFAVAGNQTQVAVLTAVSPLPPELDAPVNLLLLNGKRNMLSSHGLQSWIVLCSS